MKKTAAVLCAALLALSACGNGDSDTSSATDKEDQASATAKANIKAAVLDEDSGLAGGAKPSQEQAGCIADGMVDDVGIDALKKYGLLDEQLEVQQDAQPTKMEAEDADALAGVFTDCIDIEKMFAAQLGSGKDKLPADQQKCITDALDEDALRAGLSASFQGKQDRGFADMQKAMMSCVMGDVGAGGGS